MKYSTRTTHHIEKLSFLNAEPFIVDIDNLDNNINKFLESNILIINIPSKNISAFWNLIKSIEKSEIKKVLFVSSTSVYKNENKILFESDTQSLIDNPLLKIEQQFQDNTNFQTTILRLGGLIGYDRNPANFFKHGKTITNSTSNVNMIHRDDCINIINQIILQDIWDETFNCCADTHPTKKDFYTQAIKNMGYSIPNFEESNGESFKIISNQKIKQFLNYKFIYPDLIKIDFS